MMLLFGERLTTSRTCVYILFVCLYTKTFNTYESKTRSTQTPISNSTIFSSQTFNNQFIVTNINIIALTNDLIICLIFYIHFNALLTPYI